MSKPRTVHTLESLMARTVEDGDCLLWQGYITNKTPQVGAYPDGKKTMVSVRKLMRELQTGKPQPKGSYGNTCGKYACVNPDHTIWKSEAVHMKAMAKKRRVTNVTASKLRQYRVETGQAKLCESEAQEIRLSSESGPVLAKRFGVSKSWVNKIKRGEVWRVLSSPWQGLFK
jgi:hypothetical protein